MIKDKILNGKTFLGIELGSTRIKACLVDDTYALVASGSYDWENSFDGKYWTYSLDEVKNGVKACYKSLCDDVLDKYGVKIETFGALGVSAMMHGYLAFDENWNLLAPFRTWRNTTTKQASEILTDLFGFNIPQRWSISHLYQAILNEEAHVEHISHITTLASYVHYLLTGKHEIGIGDGSGMFPVADGDYNQSMLDKFDKLVADKKYKWNIREILPQIKSAGHLESILTQTGAEFLDASGNLKSGIPVCPPEGDAGTGMVATNAVSERTGNISAGTSVFAMLVLDKPLSKLHEQIDMVTTPDGLPVAMVHCNNCCNELDTWVNIFGEFAQLCGNTVDKSEIYDKLYRNALDSDCSGIVAYNYLSGEHITEVKQGRPMYFRLPESKMNLASFMKAQLYSSIATLAVGMEILFDEEKMTAERFSGHGGLFKVRGVAQQILADALCTPISVMETAGEGGAWGMALLAAYMVNNNGKKLGAWLEENAFANQKSTILVPRQEKTAEFVAFKQLYKEGLMTQKIAQEAE